MRSRCSLGKGSFNIQTHNTGVLVPGDITLLDMYVNSFSLIEPIEFIPRIGGLGLGATPRAPPPEKKDRIKKPGEEPKKVLGPYIDKDGRVKHVKKIGEEIPQQPLQGADNNNV